MPKIVFTGDIAFTGFFSDKCSQQVVDKTILDFLNDSDYVVANVETPVTKLPDEGKKIINIVSPPEMADDLVSMNMRIWNVCNNHADDCGVRGMEDTVAIAREHKCIPLGIGNIPASKYQGPIIVGGDECRVGIVSVTDYLPDYPFLLTWSKKEILEAMIQKMRGEVNYMVVVFHGGREFSTMPTPNEREIYKLILEMGADVVVAHHPHVVQNYETVGRKIIFYSLGNFIFDIDYQRRFNYTDIGLLLRINFTSSGFEWDYLPTKLDREREFITAMDLNDAPEIFCDIQDRDYRLLFPLAAKYLRKNERKITAYIKDHSTKTDEFCSPIQRAKKYYRKLRDMFSKYRSMLRVCSAFSGLYRLSKHRDLFRYISNS